MEEIEGKIEISLNGFLKKFDGEYEDGKLPVEMIEIKDNKIVRTITDPKEIKKWV